MNFQERLGAVLDHRMPDQVPFMCFDNLLPRGELEVALRERGMGLCLRRPVIWCEYPHVDTQVQSEAHISTITYRTPMGDVSVRQRTHVGYMRDDVSCQMDGLIKDVGDYGPVIFMIEDAVFHVDTRLYAGATSDIGADGIVRDSGPRPPYDEASRYFGYNYGVINPHQGLVNWIYHQEHHAGHFARLLAALQEQQKRRLEAVLASPVDFVSLGSLDGHYGPERWREHVLPFYKESVPTLRSAGKVCALHAHARGLTIYKDLIAETGVDVVEAVTPPPGGDLDLAEARRCWGPQTIIWVNIPEVVLWHGAEETKAYVRRLLRGGAPGGALILGFTEMGTMGVFDDESERVVTEGSLAIMDVIAEDGACPVG